MKPFTFIRANEARIAMHATQQNSSGKIIAGGTNLLDLMKLEIETPEQLIDINLLPMKKIEVLPDGALRIGALVRNSDLAYHPIVRKKYVVLSEALLSGASPQLRNMATVGGNLMQRTRCPYFYDTVFPCNKRVPGSGCAAMDGYNRSHAILGTSNQCIATHPSDMCVALSALDAVVRVSGLNGERTIPVVDFHLVPGESPDKETRLEKGEIITSVEIPAVAMGTKSRYLKVRDRASYEFALASAAVVLEMNGGTIQKAKIAFGGIATKPWRASQAEQALKGARLEEAAFQSAAAAALQEAKPRKFNGFKVELAKRTLIRALKITGGVA
ncbi:MAG: FAD-binding molybdopterin dehydrogenase [Verrucomicrobiales bacterium]|nr:FAD-binding molybdopterin dehydrogenase [Verrucomicrobiales bacterium]